MKEHRVESHGSYQKPNSHQGQLCTLNCPSQERRRKNNENRRTHVAGRQNDSHGGDAGNQNQVPRSAHPENSEVYDQENHDCRDRDYPILPGSVRIQYRLEQEKSKKYEPNIRRPAVLAIVRNQRHTRIYILWRPDLRALRAPAYAIKAATGKEINTASKR